MSEVKQLNEFQILGEIAKIDRELDGERSVEGTLPPVPRIELTQRKTQLKHQLKLLKMKTASGKDAEAVKAHYKRQAEEIRKKQLIEKEKEKERIKKAKEEMKQDKSMQIEMASDLSDEELEAILKQRRNQK